MKVKLLIPVPSVYCKSVVQLYIHNDKARIFQWGGGCRRSEPPALDDFYNFTTKITHFYAYFGKI